MLRLALYIVKLLLVQPTFQSWDLISEPAFVAQVNQHGNQVGWPEISQHVSCRESNSRYNNYLITTSDSRTLDGQTMLTSSY